MQLALIQDDTIKKTIKTVSIRDLDLSPYNPRSTRPDDHTNNLAQRISRNGFEITRALWVYRNSNGGYKVFAGGTRLEAARRAGCKTVPVVVHEGLTEKDIVRLAYEDNENDEYHAPVSIVDVWANYAALSEQGWTQQEIADAVGVGQKMVSNRLRLNALPGEVKKFSSQGKLTEGHLTEILVLEVDYYFQPWLTTEAAQLELCQTAAEKSLSVRDTKKIVNALKSAVAMADNFYASIDKDWHHKFIDELAKLEARTVKDVQRAIDVISIQISKERKRFAEEAARAADEAQLAQIEAEKAAQAARHRELIEDTKIGDWWELGDHLLYCGDTSKPDFHEKLSKATFAFADPPYNAAAADWDNNFNWGHDWLAHKAAIVAVTPGISSIFDFAQKTSLPYQWSIACWIKNGMTRGALGFGNWIYTAIFSDESIYKEAQDHFFVTISTSQTDDTSHKGRKPPAYMDKMINLFTDYGDVVIDPFAGSGQTLLACERSGRKCITGEIDSKFCKEIIEAWESETGSLAKRASE